MVPNPSAAAPSVGDVPDDLQGRTVGEAMLHAPKVVSHVTTVADLRAFFDDDHVHAALVVDTDGRLLTVVERDDLEGRPSTRPATDVGSLAGRTLAPRTPLPEAWLLMTRQGRRRLAVVDPASGRLLGLLCLQRSGRGFCTDAGAAERRAARDGSGSAVAT